MESRIPPLPEPWPTDVADELRAMMSPGVPPLALFRVLARSPRILGKIRASNLLDRGISPTSVAARMMTLPEAQPLAAMTDRDFIDRLYQNALGRSADADGMTYWLAQTTARGRSAIAAFLANEIEAITV